MRNDKALPLSPTTKAAIDELAQFAAGLLEGANEAVCDAETEDDDAFEQADQLSEESGELSRIAIALSASDEIKARRLFVELDSDLSERVQCFCPAAYALLCEAR